jgi:putative protease
LEVFVHGAMCVSYSGQCLASASLGGRSANRGMCAQPCRLPYELIRDGQSVPMGDRRYLLSAPDLAGLEVLPELVRLGFRTLKIEGRLKSAQYVANITRIYRKALDACFRGTKGQSDSAKWAEAHSLEKVRYDMEMAFSRGLTAGWFRGANHQEFIHAQYGNNRGVYLGKITRLERSRVVVKLEGPLKPGDGVVFDNGHPDQPEEGGRVYAVQQCGLEAALSFGHGDLNQARLHVGDKLWKTSDPDLDRRLRQSYAGDQSQFQRPVTLQVYGAVGQPLIVFARDELGHVVKVTSELPLTRAKKHPLTSHRLRAQLGRLGGSPFLLADIRLFLEGRVILPVSELNRLRREWVSALEALRAKPPRWTLSSRDAITPQIQSAIKPARPLDLIVLVRSLPQLEAALRGGIRTVYGDFADPSQCGAAVRRVRNWQSAASVAPLAESRSAIGNQPRSIFLAPPRITKPGEDGLLRQLRACEADGYLARNYDHLRFFSGCRLVGDFSLNIANPLSAEYFIQQCGLERVTASYDLDSQQLETLVKAAPAEWFEVTIHQHTPLFHMEHCVFCAFLSSGADHKNCGRPCEKHAVRLRDRIGAEHLVKADTACRNTVFNERITSQAESANRLLAIGVRALRLEFLDETPLQVEQTIAYYKQRLQVNDIDRPRAMAGRCLDAAG